jgi:hypothetical protein
VVDYVDGLLIMEIRDVIGNTLFRGRVSSRNPAGSSRELPPFAVLKELILLGVDGGMTDMDIAAEMGIEAEYVSYVRRHYSS